MVLQLKALTYGGAIVHQAIIEVPFDHVPIVFDHDDEDGKKRKFHLKIADQMAGNMYRVIYVEKKVSK